MLGYVQAETRGQSDETLAAVVRELKARGWALAGAVQVNHRAAPDRAGEMDLHVLATGSVVRISQRLGPLARGCRLDPAGLERAVGLTEGVLASLAGQGAPRLLVVNKFGKQEAEGRGFRPLIGRALAEGIPVLTAVSPRNLPGFAAFDEGMGDPLPADRAAILDWCRSVSGVPG